jgi:RecA-family ATPase
MTDKYADAMQDQGDIDRRYLQLSARCLTVDQLKALPPPTPIVDNYLFKGTVAWLHGKWGSFKSFVAIDIASCVATGIPWHNHDVVRGNVLYLAAEGAKGLGKRVEAWEKHHHNPDMAQLTTLPVPVQLADLDNVDVPAVIMLVKQYNASLLILDTQARVTTGKDENSGRDMSVFTANLSEIVEATGVTILVVHHEPRKAENLRGHSSLEGAADSIFRCEKQGEDTMVMENTKQKDTDEAPDITFTKALVADSCILAHDDTTVERNKLSELERKVLNILGGFTDGEATSGEFLDSVVPETCSKPHYYRVRNKLKRKFKIDQKPKGSSKVWYVTDWTGIDPDAV